MFTKPYRLTKGKHHQDGKVYTAGDTIYLTDAQYLAFQDRFLAEEVYHQNTELDAAIRTAQEKAKQDVLDAHAAEQANIKQKAAEDAKKALSTKTVEAAAVVQTKAAVVQTNTVADPTPVATLKA